MGASPRAEVSNSFMEHKFEGGNTMPNDRSSSEPATLGRGSQHTSASMPAGSTKATSMAAQEALCRCQGWPGPHGQVNQWSCLCRKSVGTLCTAAALVASRLRMLCTVRLSWDVGDLLHQRGSQTAAMCRPRPPGEML